MSDTHALSGAAAVNFLSNRFGETGNVCLLSVVTRYLRRILERSPAFSEALLKGLVPKRNALLCALSDPDVRIPLIPATDSGGRRPPVPEQSGRVLSERSDAGFS
jgi:hypothetical protein